MKNLFAFLLVGGLFVSMACAPEKTQKTVKVEAPTYSIAEILNGYWAVTDLAIAGVSKEVDKERAYFYEFKDDGTFETGSIKSTLKGRFFVEADTIWMIPEITELEPQHVKVFEYNKDTMIVGGIHEKTQQPLRMTMVNLEREKLPKN